MEKLPKYVYEPISGLREKIKIIIRLLSAVLFIVFLSLLPSLVGLLGLGEFYAKYIFPVIALFPNSLSDMFIFSMTEFIVIIGSIAFVTLLISLLIKQIKHKKRYGSVSAWFYFMKNLGTMLIVFSIFFGMYILMHGINFRRDSVVKHMQLQKADEDFEIYYKALMWSYNGMLNARDNLGEDFNGVAHLQSNFDVLGIDANALMEAFSDSYGLNMTHNLIKPKSVALSHLWSYTYIMGMYDPILGEANVNTDYLNILDFPVTVCHEISHCKGYASETEANTAAILACIHSDRADFRYSGYYNIFCNLYGVVYEYARNTDNLDRMEYFLSNPDMKPVFRDMNAEDRYYASLQHGVIPEAIEYISEMANNTFLEMNGQSGGTYTYHVPSNTYVNFYYTYVLPEES